jgi:hypothetical protein
MSAEVNQRAMLKAGIVQEITDKKWSNAYRYEVGKGIRLFTMDLNKHVPSQLYTDDHRH